MAKSRPDLAARNRKNAQHAMTRTPEHISWCAMRQRCLDKNSKDYANYGGRGIDIDPRWADFRVFFADMGKRPRGTTLGRINNDEGYWPWNCRWETDTRQCSNRRTTRSLTYNGRTLTLAEWARELGVPRQTIRYRVAAGWEVADIVSRQPDRSIRRKPVNGHLAN